MSAEDIIALLCQLLSVFAALGVLFSERTKTSALFMWFAGLFSGVVFMYWGFEFLALLHWVLSTMSAGVFLLCAITFGESKNKTSPKDLFIKIACLFLLSAVILGLHYDLGFNMDFITSPNQELSLNQMGGAALEDYFIVVSIISVTAFLIIMGITVMHSKTRRGT